MLSIIETCRGILSKSSTYNHNTPHMNQVLKAKLKDRGLRLLYHARILENLLRRRSKNAAMILAYHRINTRHYISSTKLYPGMYVSKESFELQIDWLAKHFKIVSVSRIITDLKHEQSKAWDEPLCAITFDDGWYDNYEHAFPIMKKYNLPWTIFIVKNTIGTSRPTCYDMCFEIIANSHELSRTLTGIESVDSVIRSNLQNRIQKARLVINQIRRLQADEFDRVFAELTRFYYENLDAEEIDKKYRFLSWEEIKRLQDSGVEFGYHGQNHYMLTKLPEYRIEDELVLPVEVAKANGIDIKKIFCYPDGQFHDGIIKTLQELGYEGAASMIQGFNNFRTDPYKLRRHSVHEGCAGSLPHFLYNISR